MGACIRKRVVYDMWCKRFQFFVNVEALFGRQLTRALDVIQSYVTRSDILVSEVITGVRRR